MVRVTHHFIEEERVYVYFMKGKGAGVEDVFISCTPTGGMCTYKELSKTSLLHGALK